MPCRSYDSDWVDYSSRKNSSEVVKLKAEADKLARTACRAFSRLEELGELDSIKDTEARAWWARHKKADEAARAKEAEEKAKKDAAAKLLKDAMSKLSDEELIAFNLKKPATRGRKKGVSV